MPVKKKSGFQITSVTTAQVAASSITEDTESLDDPDESRTEDISSEIFDVSSRATDYEHGAEVCERSSSDETLNNVGEADTPGATSPNIPHDRDAVGQAFGGRGLPAAGGGTATPPASSSSNSGPAPGATPPPSTSGSGTSTGGGGGAAPLAMQPAVACTSRFRVIKLDHGSGEPFRRGRWTCTEFYDRDSDGTILARSADSIRHSSSSTLEQQQQQQCGDRDSGLGATNSSVILPPVHGTESLADAALGATIAQLAPTDVTSQHQSFAKGQQPAGGLPVSQAASSNQIYTASAAAGQQHQSQVNLQSSLGQLSLLQINGKAIHTPGASVPQANSQQTANIPTPQPQQFQFSQTQIPHLLPSQSTIANSHTEYMQHLPVMQGPGVIQPSPVKVVQNTSLSASQATSHGPSMVMQPSASGAQVPAQSCDLVNQGGQGIQNTQPGPTQGLILQQQSLGSSGVQQHLNQQHQASGLQSGMVSQVPGLPSGSLSVAAGIQNLPSTGVSSVLTGVSAVGPSASATSVTMPSAPVTMVQSQLSTQAPITGSLMQGSVNLSSNVSQTSLFQIQQGTGQLEERRNSEQFIPQTSQSSDGKPSMKPLIPEILGNPLHLQVSSPMNSLSNSVFSIPIQIDGDEDRNPSAAFYRAFPVNKSRDAKNLYDSASGASVVAIDNKIEQAMDLVKSHLMYAVREEVEVLKEQIKELIEKNCILERENSLLKSLANNEQLSQLQTQVTHPSSTSQTQQPTAVAQPQHSAQQTQPPLQPNVPSA
ncbi:TSC22 domain family protein 2 isoform X2 [Carcharodon carcharias]|uniref:TSC22 domain family protein 2 isoform X2 n=1 Tax=Carcharodon carcharias TaxID=13397 RepID=UPI001B7E7104|nr:TSC22 domain family protein 2 isoform X2 [Carcharodon carcharias]